MADRIIWSREEAFTVVASRDLSSEILSQTSWRTRQAPHVGHKSGEQRGQVVLSPDESQWQRQLEVGDCQYRHAVRTSPAGGFHDETYAHALSDECQYRRFFRRFLNDPRRFQAATECLRRRRGGASVCRSGRDVRTLDILVNNASVFGFASLEQTTDEQLHTMLDTNLWGTIITCREALKHFGNHGDSIINLGSMSSDASPRAQSLTLRPRPGSRSDWRAGGGACITRHPRQSNQPRCRGHRRRTGDRGNE